MNLRWLILPSFALGFALCALWWAVAEEAWAVVPFPSMAILMGAIGVAIVLARGGER